MSLQKSDLNAGQLSVLATGKQWWDSTEQVLVVDGEPGTGKTSVVKFLLDELTGATPLFSAPTHEATNQLASRLPESAICETTHKALGLKASKFYANLRFVKGEVSGEFKDCNVLVLDEASMAGMKDTSDEKAVEELLDFALTSHSKIIALGDWAQLPPISSKSGDSPIFEQGFRTETLKKVERHDGDILQYVQAVRSEILKPTRRVPKTFGEIRELKTPAGQLPKFSTEMMEEIATDKGRIITWTNGKTKYSREPGVREYNQVFRDYKFGTELASKNPFLPSDTILFSSPVNLLKGNFEDHEKVSGLDFKPADLKRMATVNSRGTVLRVETFTLLNVESYKLMVELSQGVTVICYIPTARGKIAYDKIVTGYKAKAKECLDGVSAGKLYAQMHTFTDLFTSAIHTYCITGHKSQGSTISSVYVDVRNILQMRPTEWKVAFKLLNVACSRAGERLTLIRGV